MELNVKDNSIILHSLLLNHHDTKRRSISGKSALIPEAQVTENRAAPRVEVRPTAGSTIKHKCYFCGRDYPTQNALRSHALHTCSATGGRNRMATAMLIRDVNKKTQFSCSRQESTRQLLPKFEPFETELQEDIEAGSQGKSEDAIEPRSNTQALAPPTSIHISNSTESKSRERVKDSSIGAEELILPDWMEVAEEDENVMENFPSVVVIDSGQTKKKDSSMKRAKKPIDIVRKEGGSTSKSPIKELVQNKPVPGLWECAICHQILHTASNLKRHLLCIHKIFITTKVYTVEVLPPEDSDNLKN